jgi:hypothetical protein
MKTPAKIVFLLLASLASAYATSIDDAKKCFARYVSLETTFDPTAADLYADDAKIQNTRIYPTGKKRVLTMPAKAYKQLIRQVMPLAKERGDTNSYSEIKFAQEGDKVRATATRYSNLKKYSSPISLLFGTNKNGECLIYEELSESKP